MKKYSFLILISFLANGLFSQGNVNDPYYCADYFTGSAYHLKPVIDLQYLKFGDYSPSYFGVSRTSECFIDKVDSSKLSNVVFYKGNVYDLEVGAFNPKSKYSKTTKFNIWDWVPLFSGPPVSGSSFSDDCSAVLMIDFNNDGDFLDVDEEIIFNGYYSNGNPIKDIFISNKYQFEGSVRARLKLSQNNFTSSNKPNFPSNECHWYTSIHGDIIDFNITIKNGIGPYSCKPKHDNIYYGKGVVSDITVSNTTYSYINDVQINGNGSKNSGNNNGYDYFPNSGINIHPGYMEDFVLKSGYKNSTSFPLTSPQYGVWIDLNGDGDFEDKNEFIARFTNDSTLNYNVPCINHGKTSTEIESCINIPTTYSFSGKSRMRVVMTNNSTLIEKDDYCSLNFLGETEDYEITISSLTPTVLLDCSNGRYVNEVFSDFELTSDIKFGENISPITGVNEELTLDLYEPKGDLETKRPLIIFLHGGSFKHLDKSQMNYLCEEYVKRGFVTATAEYRLTNWTNQQEAITASIRCMHDAKAAVRFFRKNASQYKIDTDQIIIAGNSAGAMGAMTFVIDDTEWTRPIVGFPAPNVSLSMMADPTDNTLEGASGNTGFSSEVAAIVNFSGAILDTSWIDVNDPIIVSMHDDLDPKVPYKTAQGMHGSYYIHEQAAKVGLLNDLYTYTNSNGHHNYIEPGNVNSTQSRQYVADFLSSKITCAPKGSNLNNTLGNNNPIDTNSVDTTQTVVNTNTGNNGSNNTNTGSNSNTIDNLMITQLVSPVSGCEMTSTETVSVNVTNHGGIDVSSFDISYTVNGKTITETVTQKIDAGKTIIYTFNTLADLSIPGEHQITTIIVGSNNNQASNVKMVNNSGKLSVDLGVDKKVCAAGLELDATTVGATYDWSSGESTAKITPQTSGNYSVTITKNGCTATDEVNVDFLANIQVTETIVHASCGSNDGSIEVNSQNNVSYLWSNGNTSNKIENLNANNYWLIATDNTTGCSISKSFTLSEAVMNFEFVKDTIEACGEQTTFADAGFGYTTYSWSNGETTQKATITKSGNYTVTVSLGQNCTATDEIYVNVNCLASTNEENTDNVITSVNSNISQDIVVFPNPNNGLFNIKGEEIELIEIFNMNGQLIESRTELSNIQTFQLEINGLYLVKIQSQNSTQIQRVIVK
jgi:hypothetical protein